MEYTFESDGLVLVGHLSVPARVSRSGTEGLVICHGFPSPSNGRLDAALSYYDLADRVSEQLGWIVLAFTYRGCGGSEGDFSLGGWLDDTLNAVAHLAARVDVNRVWVVGFGTGGAMAISAAAVDPRIAGVAGVAPPADFDDWKNDPEGLLGYARRVGAIRTAGFPQDEDRWREELGTIRAIEAVAQIGDRPLLVLHGAADEVVPPFDARVLADAHGSADLRIIEGGGHRLRFDPRANAILLGWLERCSRDSGEPVSLGLIDS